MYEKMPLKLSHLLQARESLRRGASLANLAFAYQTLTEFAVRIAAAKLHGSVSLKSVDPDAERYCASLTALDGSQAVIEEHFTDEHIMDLADAIAYITAGESVDVTFHIEDLAENFIVPLRAVLERAGIVIDSEFPKVKANSPKGLA